MPSGGDWAIERNAVVFIENSGGENQNSMTKINLKDGERGESGENHSNSEVVIVKDCVFENIDGNGIMLSGRNVGAGILRNEFYHVGGTAIVLFGKTDEMNGNGVDGVEEKFP